MGSYSVISSFDSDRALVVVVKFRILVLLGSSRHDVEGQPAQLRANDPAGTSRMIWNIRLISWFFSCCHCVTCL